MASRNFLLKVSLELEAQQRTTLHICECEHARARVCACAGPCACASACLHACVCPREGRLILCYSRELHGLAGALSKTKSSLVPTALWCPCQFGVPQ